MKADNKKELYLIVFKDDDDKIKEKHAFIKEDDFWITIQFVEMPNKVPYGNIFKIPRTRVLKMKEVEG